MAAVDEVLTALAEYLTTVDGIGRAHYPFPSTIPTTSIPAIIIEPHRIDWDEFAGGGRQNWHVGVRLVIVKPRTSAQTGDDFNVVNSLIPNVKDAISVTADDQSIIRKIPHFKPLVSQGVSVVGITSPTALLSLQYFYGGATYAASQVDTTVKFARKTPGV